MHTHTVTHIHTERGQQTHISQLGGKMRTYIYKQSQWPFSFTINHVFYIERTPPWKLSLVWMCACIYGGRAAMLLGAQQTVLVEHSHHCPDGPQM